MILIDIVTMTLQNFLVFISSFLLLFFVRLHTKNLEEPVKMSFYYFAYGSNLLSKRIHINNPSALRVDIGRLDNYRLDFAGYSDKWRGAVATVVPTETRTVWGAVWQIDIHDMHHLDKQEGVEEGVYRALEHCIVRKNGSTLLCRMYQHCACPKDNGKLRNLPMNRRPSASYMDTIREGGRESTLPTEYMKFLFTIPDNGNTVSLEHLTNSGAEGELKDCIGTGI